MIYVLFIRHGFSCSNYIKETDWKYLITTNYEPDTKLTGLGKKQAYNNGTEILEKVHNLGLNMLPYFFTSVLTRAIQTAVYIREGLEAGENIPIITIPNVEEIGAKYFKQFDYQNQGRNINEVRDDLELEIHSFGAHDNNGDIKKSKGPSNFYTDRLPILVDEFDVHDGDVLIVVSHRKAIEKITGVSLGNLGAVLQEVSVSNNKFVPKSAMEIDRGFRKEESILNSTLEDTSECSWA
jgi:broad specificity phosphatase PhoE